MANRLDNLAFKNARKRRRFMFQRVGAGRVRPAYRVPVGAANSSPVTEAQGQDPVSLLWTMEFFGVSQDPIGDTLYPAGTLLDTGGLTVTLANDGELELTITAKVSNRVTVNLSDPSLPGGGTPARGIHTVLAYTNSTNRTALYVDGHLLGRDGGAIFTEWADGVADWEYMNVVSDLGLVSDLQVFPNFTPAIFVD